MQIIIFYYIYLLPFETFFAFTRNNTGLHGIFFSVTTQQHLAPTHTHTVIDKTDKCNDIVNNVNIIERKMRPHLQLILLFQKHKQKLLFNLKR